MPLFIPARNPRVERSKLVVYNFCNYKWEPFSHVSRGTVIDWSATQLRSKEAYGVWKIEDAYSKGVSLVEYLEQSKYVRLLYRFILNIFRWRLRDSSVLDTLVLSCNDKLSRQGEKKPSGNFNVRKGGQQVEWEANTSGGKVKQC